MRTKILVSAFVFMLFSGCAATIMERLTIGDSMSGADLLINKQGRITSIYVEGKEIPGQWSAIYGKTPEGNDYMLLSEIETDYK